MVVSACFASIQRHCAAISRSSAMQNALNLLVRKQERIEGRPVTPLHGGHVGMIRDLVNCW